MSNFIPSKGDHFYVAFKPWDHHVGGLFSDTVQVMKVHDRSYRGDVFECIGRDDHAVVGRRNSESNPIVTFVHDEVNYFPVGPEILSCLSLVAGDSKEPTT